jgi:hypothetical protein
VPEINGTVIPNGCVLRSSGHRSLQGRQALRACCCYPVLSGTAAKTSAPEREPLRAPARTALVFPSHPETGRARIKHHQMREGAAMDDDSLLDELQEDLGSDYSPQLRVAAGMLSGDAQAAVPYLLFSIAKSLEDISFLLANDSVSVVMETDEDE